jgi:ribose 5-phosphate isomerase A
MTDLEIRKQQAAHRAIEHVKSGMIVGLGTGSTARHAIAAIGQKLSRGELRNIKGVPTSAASKAQAVSLGIPIIELGPGGVDVAIDGMDEVTPELDAIKGLGGALTREKIVASHAKVFILIGDERKLVSYLGERSALPVEVIPFAWEATQFTLAGFAEALVPRKNECDKLFMTDNGNYIIDLTLGEQRDPQQLNCELSCTPGVVDHGLFLGMADLAYIAYENRVEELS